MLPRKVSAEQDAREGLNAAPSLAIGLCFCIGPFGGNRNNDLVDRIRRVSDHMHFLYLRSTQRDEEGNLYETRYMEEDRYEVVNEVVFK